LIRIPPILTDEQAASIPVAATTAALGLQRLFNFPQRPPLGKTLLVCGGASSVGMYTCQLASLAGMRVIATASPSNFDLVRSFGASLVVDYHNPDVVKQVLREAGNAGIDYVYDAISMGGTLSLSAAVLKAKGSGHRKCAVVLPIAAESLDAAIEYHPVGIMTIFDKPYEFMGLALPPMPQDYIAARAIYRAIAHWLTIERFKPNPVFIQEGGLDRIPDGIAQLRGGKISGGKLVYRISRNTIV